MSLVDPLDAGIEVGARLDKALCCFRQLVHDRQIAVLRVAKPTLRAPALRPIDLTGLDRSLGQKPGDDVHDPRRDLQRLAGEADACERLKRGSVVAPDIVEIMTSL